MQEIWIRPGREATVQARFQDTLKSLKGQRTEVRSAWDRESRGHTRLSRAARLYSELTQDIGTAQATLDNIRDYTASNLQRRQHCGANGHIMQESRANSTPIPEINPNKRKNGDGHAKVEISTQPEPMQRKEPVRTFKICRLGDPRVDGTLRIIEVNGWLDKIIARVADTSPQKAQAISAMIEYLSGQNVEGVENGRAATRNPSKKRRDERIGIDGKSYPVRSLKPDGIPSVELKGKELAHVRIKYTTVGDSRVIIKIYTDRDKYN